MKKILCFLMVSCLALSLCACSGQSGETAESSVSSGTVSSEVNEDRGDKLDIDSFTMDTLTENSVIGTMLEMYGGFQAVARNNDEGNDGYDAGDIIITYLQDGDIIRVSQQITYDDGYAMSIYYDTGDTTIYVTGDSGASTSSYDEAAVDKMLTLSMFGYEDYSCTITDRTEKDGVYQFKLELLEDGVLDQKETVSVDPYTGMILKVESTHFIDDEEFSTSEYNMIYGSDVQVDMSAKTEYEKDSD